MTVNITSVRWSPEGDMLITGSESHRINIIDFATGKNLFTTKTADDSNKFTLITFLNILFRAR